MTTIIEGKGLECPKCHADIGTVTITGNGMDGVCVECSCGYAGTPAIRKEHCTKIAESTFLGRITPDYIPDAGKTVPSGELAKAVHKLKSVIKLRLDADLSDYAYWQTIEAALSELEARRSEVKRKDALVQAIMGRLADLLDDDQFNNIDGMVQHAGVP